MIPAMRRLGHDVVAVASGTRRAGRPHTPTAMASRRPARSRTSSRATTSTLSISAAPTNTIARRRSSPRPPASTSCARSRSRCQSRTGGRCSTPASGPASPWRPTTTCPARASTARSGASSPTARSGESSPSGCFHAVILPARLQGWRLEQPCGWRRDDGHHLPRRVGPQPAARCSSGGRRGARRQPGTVGRRGRGRGDVHASLRRRHARPDARRLHDRVRPDRPPGPRV